MQTYNNAKLREIEERYASYSGAANGLSEKYRAIAFRRMEADKVLREADACPHRSRDKTLMAELGQKARKLLQEENAVAEQVGTARQHADRLKQLIACLKTYIQKTGALPRD